MAVDLCSENSNMSPRISFSSDFGQSDVIPIERRPLRSSSRASSLDSSVDFDFCFAGDQDSYSAADFFSEGKILPTEIKKKTDPATHNTLRPESPKQEPGRSKSTKQETGFSAARKHEMGLPESPNQDLDRPKLTKLEMGRPGSRKQETGGPETEKSMTVKRDKTGNDNDVVTAVEEKHNTRSFWGFKRSSSLNCGSGYGRSLCPIPLLSRSNSTGSTSNVNSNKQKQSLKKQQEHIKQFNHQKPPLKKSYGVNHYGNGVRVNPLLNVNSGNLFGLGSIFSNGGKDKNKKR